MKRDFEAAPKSLVEEVTALRHELHRHPEIRLEERWTADRIARYLDEAGIPHERGVGVATGIVATLEGEAGKTIALRADMDALEIQEDTGLPYASSIPNRMHACGHDGHSACLCGAAKALTLRREALPGTVKFIFQPGEEVAAAGRRMVDAGVLDGVAAVFALHSWPGVPVGRVAFRSGPAMASADFFRIEVRGRGCHGAYPASGVDPILVAAHIVVALQSLVSRELPATDAGVVTVARLGAGSGANIIAERAELEGTFRALTPEVRDLLARGIERVALHTARAFRAEAKVHFDGGPYPPLCNDPAMTAFARDVVVCALGPEAAMDLTQPSMGAEDFAYYLRRVPGAMLYLGVSPPDKPSPPLHNSKFDFNDAAIPIALQTLTGLAQAFLES